MSVTFQICQKKIWTHFYQTKFRISLFQFKESFIVQKNTLFFWFFLLNYKVSSNREVHIKTCKLNQWKTTVKFLTSYIYLPKNVIDVRCIITILWHNIFADKSRKCMPELNFHFAKICMIFICKYVLSLINFIPYTAISTVT